MAEFRFDRTALLILATVILNLGVDALSRGLRKRLRLKPGLGGKSPIVNNDCKGNMKLYQVDAFTSSLFRGNPAAVVPLERWLDDALLQNHWKTTCRKPRFWCRMTPAMHYAGLPPGRSGFVRSCHTGRRMGGL